MTGASLVTFINSHEGLAHMCDMLSQPTVDPLHGYRQD